MPLKKLLFIGPLNLGSNPQGGDSYKNRLILKYLDSRFELSVIDTSNWKKSSSVIFRLIKNLFFTNFHRVIISANTLSSFFLLIMMNINKKVLKKTVYMVIGGDFGILIQKKKRRSQFYKGLHRILVEGDLQKAELANSPLFKMTSVLCNFKDINKIWNSEKNQKSDKIQFVFLSRIHEEKGVLDIFEALELLSINDRNDFRVDFYGPIDKPFKSRFLEKIKEYDSICAYNGYLDILAEPSYAYSLLSEYDALLFPTLNKAEGFAGVFIDAFICGLPVITTNWRINREIIRPGVNGYLINPRTPMEIKELFLQIKREPKKLAQIKINNLSIAHKYHYENILEKGLLPYIK